MRNTQDAYFALYGTASFLGLAVARHVVREGDTVYEFGANVGTETLSLAHLVGLRGRIVAVEADPILAAELSRRLVQNRLTQSVVVPRAVWNESGWARLDRNCDHPGQSFVRGDPGGGDGLILTTTGDELLREFGPPGFIFMDIEGSEYACLDGAKVLLEEARPVIFTEVVGTHLRRAGSTVEEFANLVWNSGYVAFDAWTRRFSEVTRATVTPETYSEWVLVPEERRLLSKELRLTLIRARVMPRVRWLSPLGSW